MCRTSWMGSTMLLMLLLGTCTWPSPAQASSTSSSSSSSSTTSTSARNVLERTANGLRAAMRTYDDCQLSEDGFSVCLKRKAIAMLDRVARIDSIAVADGVRLERAASAAGDWEDTDATNTITAAADWEQQLPRSAEGRESMVTEVLLQRVATLLGGRAVTVRLPQLSAAEIGRGLEEGRGKMKKMMHMMVMGFMMKMATMIPVAIALLYVLAGKALIISKIALLLAGIIAIKKLISMKGASGGGGGGGGSSGGWQSSGGGGSGHGGGGWDRRSNEAAAVASHPLAYRAYATAIMQ